MRSTAITPDTSGHGRHYSSDILPVPFRPIDTIGSRTFSLPKDLDSASDTRQVQRQIEGIFDDEP